jgi:hypothetical protein
MLGFSKAPLGVGAVAQATSIALQVMASSDRFILDLLLMKCLIVTT